MFSFCKSTWSFTTQIATFHRMRPTKRSQIFQTGVVQMSTQAMSSTLIILLAVAFLITRQVLPRRISRFPFIVFPVVGLYEMIQSLPSPIISGWMLVECGISLAWCATVGYFQAKVTTVFEGTDGQWYMRGGWKYLAWWLVLIAFRMAIMWAFHTGSFSIHGVEWIMWSNLAMVWGSRAVFLTLLHPQIRPQLIHPRFHRDVRHG